MASEIMRLWMPDPLDGLAGPSSDDDEFDDTCGPVPERTDPFHSTRFPGPPGPTGPLPTKPKLGLWGGA